jgi:hypothetical protein
VPKPLSGSILTRRLADDTLIVDAKIRSERRTLCPASEWPEARARRLLGGRLLPAALLRQDWTALIPRSGQRWLGSRALLGLDHCARGSHRLRRGAQSLREPEHGLRISITVVKHLLPFLAFADDERTADRTLAEVDEALMLRFVATKQAERSILQGIAETLAELDSDLRSDPELLRQQLDPEEWRLSAATGSAAASARCSTPPPAD